MSLFGVVALVAALVHDLSMRQSATDPVFWPWAAIALSFYVGLDVALGAMAEAWERTKQGRLRGYRSRPWPRCGRRARSSSMA